MLSAMRVTPTMFALLGVPAAMGRTPELGDLQAVVVSHRFWQERFGGDRAIVGRSLRLDGQRFTVIGVMPPTFVFSPFWARRDVWGLLDLSAKRDDRRGASLRLFARLRPGFTLETARHQVTALSSRLESAFPADHRASGWKRARCRSTSPGTCSHCCGRSCWPRAACCW